MWTSVCGRRARGGRDESTDLEQWGGGKGPASAPGQRPPLRGAAGRRCATVSVGHAQHRARELGVRLRSHSWRDPSIGPRRQAGSPAPPHPCARARRVSSRATRTRFTCDRAQERRLGAAPSGPGAAAELATETPEIGRRVEPQRQGDGPDRSGNDHAESGKEAHPDDGTGRERPNNTDGRNHPRCGSAARCSRSERSTGATQPDSEASQVGSGGHSLEMSSTNPLGSTTSILRCP